MKRRLVHWQFAGFFITSLCGSLLHFLYEWTDQSIFIGLFSAVNESTWEHMKLLFFPLFIFALVQKHFFKEYENFWWIKLSGIVTGLILIPVLFYTCNGVFGKTPDWVNIASFFVAAAITFILETSLFKKEISFCKKTWIPFFLICLIGILFVVFTFVTPKIPLFQDPLTGSYGISG